MRYSSSRKSISSLPVDGRRGPLNNTKSHFAPPSKTISGDKHKKQKKQKKQNPSPCLYSIEYKMFAVKDFLLCRFAKLLTTNYAKESGKIHIPARADNAFHEEL